ncbi:D-glycero-beta-D-manno-heptose-7-phosphate kinase [Pelagibius marinus]|uniref:D-glycero-beta-D-manno-heptose-7-phosphate kinase n=1 Tax=Pelagibius marinus TaxID=2762760 RepID=UPI0018723DA8|nr:D-glycero-beta-D-manno-heptose-7-phosphate kinase [Pelagibius marinus]
MDKRADSGEAPFPVPERPDLAAALEQLAGVPVLVLGDIMLDRFLYGGVERISPEAPIPVLRITQESAMLGGAGNVLRNLAALGARPHCIAVVGEDAAGAEVEALARTCLEPVTGEIELLRAPARRTTMKDRFIAAGQQLLRVDREPEGDLDSDTQARVKAAALAALAKASAVILSDYGKGLLDEALIAAVVTAAAERGCPVIVDPKGRDFARYRGAAWVTPNRRELAEASGLPTGDDDAVAAAARKVIIDSGIGAVLATRSEQGMTLVSGAGGQDVSHLNAEAREVYDVSGAGDTVVAAFAAALGAGLDPVTAAQLANVAAAIVVGKLGTAVARPGEILRALHASDLLAAEAKVVDLDSLGEQVAQWRKAGLKIGFTNGCFDLLHPGHVSLLEQARAACDRLIVGLNSDASVRRLKGEARPVQGEAARAAVLASLASVSRVVIFGEDTPLALIEALKPDVLVKGADYSVDQVVGADIVQAYGGKVVLAELAPGHSTTATIARLGGS